MAAAITRLGFGASGLGNLSKKISDAQARDTVDAAWQAGIRHFDTAPFYGAGLSELRLGEALSNRPRDDYYLSTEVGRVLQPAPDGWTNPDFLSGRPFRPAYDYSHDGVMRSFESSLERLGVDRIDCLYMHDIGAMTHGGDHNARLREAQGGLRALQSLLDQGVIRDFGLGVNEVEVCEEVMMDHAPTRILLAGRYSLLDQSAQSLFETCRERGVSIVAAGVFNSGILATGTRGTRTPHYDYAPAPPDIIDRVARIEAVCEAHGVSLPAGACAFVLAHPAVDTVLLGMSNPARVASNAAMLSDPIPDAFWRELVAQDLLPEDMPLP